MFYTIEALFLLRLPDLLKTNKCNSNFRTSILQMLMRLIFPPSLKTVLRQVRKLIHVLDASSALTLSSFPTLIFVTLVFRLLILNHIFPASSCAFLSPGSASFLQTEVLHHQWSLGHQVLLWTSNYHLVFWSANPWRSWRMNNPDILHSCFTSGLTSKTMSVPSWSPTAHCKVHRIILSLLRSSLEYQNSSRWSISLYCGWNQTFSQNLWKSDTVSPAVF